MRSLLSWTGQTLLLIGLVIATHTQPVLAENASVELIEGVGDWVVQEKTGRVFASLPIWDEVVEFDQKGQQVRRFSTGKSPNEMMLKHDLLIVGCRDSVALDVFDLKTNQKKGSIQVSGRGPYGLFCSQADNSYVYCLSNTGTAWWDGQVFQCDVNTMKVRRQVKIREWGQSGALHVAMSRDGYWIVADSRGYTSPSGADLMKVNEEECTFAQVRDYHESFGKIIAGPLNRYWTMGAKLYSLDIARKLREFSGSPVAIHPTKDLAASKTDAGLALDRFSDATSIDGIKLSKPPKQEKQDSGKSRGKTAYVNQFDPTVAFDLKNDLVFVGEETRGTWISLSPYSSQLKPLRMIEVPSEVVAELGKEIRVPVSVSNDAASTTMSLAGGPDNAKLEEGEIRWQTSPKFVGFNDFTLELKAKEDGRVLDSARVTVQVTTPKLELDFHVKSMELSPDRKYLVVWGPASGQEDRHPAQAGPDEVAVVDVAARKIVGQKNFPQGVRVATLNNEHVFVAPMSGSLFYRLNRSLEGDDRTFLKNQPNQLMVLGNDRLLVVGERFTSVFNTETLKLVPGPWDSQQDFANRIRVLDYGRVQLANRIIDPATGKVVEITGTTSLPKVGSTRNLQSNLPHFGEDMVKRWGRSLNKTQLLNYLGSRIAVLPGPAILSTKWPMAIVTTQTKEQSTTTTFLKLASLVDGQIVHSATIDVSINDPRQHSPNFYGANVLLLEAVDEAIYANGKELIFAAIPIDVANQITIPTFFPPQPIHVANAGEKFKFKLAFQGKVKGTTFSLMDESPSLSIDSQTGEVTLDTGAIWDTYTQSQPGILNDVRFAPRRTATLPFPEFTDNAQAYQELTGKELAADQLAVQVPISVALQDEENQSDQTTFNVLVVGSRAELEKARAEAKAQQEKQMAEMREKARAAQMAADEARMAKEKLRKGEPGIEQRIEALENKLNRMEAALDTILRRLDKLSQED
ncbi:YncE family protein [Blastopirellula marina]|nr:hypothetical protein [Blastopirellula marina]